ADAPGLLELLARNRPAIARLAHPVAYRAIVAEALAHRRALIVVSEVDDRLVAFAIIVWDWHRFRVEFLLRHPRVALAAAAGFLRRRLRTTRPRAVRAAAASPTATEEGARRSAGNGPRWNDGGADIAKVLHIGVDASMRGRGVATGLKAFYVGFLRCSGFHRVDALVERNNVASLALQRTSGWVTTSEGGDVFSYLVLDDEAVP
ncbi:MAG: GNAT family N-acetyltransferase, partial [Trueperaceae bacterium]|nr:GNAT family N-acetyltransferase [Trueperaceae bacterium]